MIKRLIISLFCLSASLSMNAQVQIRVNSQADFDQLSLKLKNAKGTVFVSFADGVFKFNDTNKIVLQGDANITFTGSDNTVIVADGEDYSANESVGTYSDNWYKVKIKKALDPFATYQDENFKSVPLTDTGFLNEEMHINVSDEAIVVTDKTKGVARIKIPKELSQIRNKKADYFANSSLYYKSQWADAYRPILYSDSKYLYFSLNKWLADRADDYVTNMYNWSIRYGEDGIQPMFVTNLPVALSNGSIMYDKQYIYIPKEVKNLHVSRYIQFLNAKNHKGVVTLRNLTFAGTGLSQLVTSWSGFDTSVPKQLLSFSNCAQANIIKCTFKNMGGVICTLDSTNSLMESNQMIDNYIDNTLGTSGICNNVVFKNNYVNNPSKVLTRGVVISQSDSRSFVVEGNTFVNVSRTAFSHGTAKQDSYILVKNNELFNTNRVNKYARRYLSSDTGALVYSWDNSRIIIDANVIHDLASNLNYSGIMLDDGSGYATITNNLIYMVMDKAVYSWKNGGDKETGLMNVMSGNIILGSSSFGGFKKSHPQNARYFRNVMFDLSDTEASDLGRNIIIDPINVNVSDKVYLPKSVYKKYKSIPFVKRFLGYYTKAR